MRVLLYSCNFAPEPTGIGKYSGELATWLAGAGHEVRVVSAPPYYPDWRVADGYRGSLFHKESRDGVAVWRAPLWVPKRPGGLTRLLHLLTFAATSLPLVLRQTLWRPHVVVTVAPAFLCAPGGWLAARLCGAKAWLHVQDFEVDVAFRLGLLKGNRLASAVRLFERVILRRFDRVSSISSRMLAHAHAKGVQASHLVLLVNWVGVKEVCPQQRGSAYRAELGIAPDAVVALYSGSLAGKQGLMVLPEAAKRLAHLPHVVMVICGDGAMKPQLEAACAGLPNVRLLPLQPAQRLGELLGMADIQLLPQAQGAEDLVMPSKLTGMLASGRPTLATCRADTEIARIVKGRGLTVPPDDANALADAIETLASAPAWREELGRSARAYAEQFLDRDAVLQRFAGELQALVGSRADPVGEFGVDPEASRVES